jgi:hypothetical protein
MNIEDDEDIHSCSYFCTRPACVLAQRDELRGKLEQAIEAEREACARVCDKIERRKWEAVMNGGAMQGIGARDCAAAIRARGKE